MEGGRGIRGNHLDPGAQEFYPTVQIAIAQPQVYYPYPPPPLPASGAVEVYHQPQLQQYVTPLPAEPATRAVILTTVPPHVGEDAVRAAVEPFGAVRAVEIGSLARDGSVTVHFYDLRSAQAAVSGVREQHLQQQSRMGNWGIWDSEATVAGAGGGGGELVLMHHHYHFGGSGLIAGYAVWAQFAAREMDGPNQGSLIVFNWDPAVPSASLVEIFQAFGDVKEVRETPSKPHKFVELFDIRDAARALMELNGKEVFGRRLVVEFSRPGGQPRSSSSNSSSSHYRRNTSHQQSFPLPPRLLRTTSEPNTWMQGRGGAPQPSSCSHEGREPVPMSQKQRQHVNVNASSSSSGGRRNKNSNSSNPSSSSPSPSPLMTRKGWKNHSKNSGEARFLFKGGEESSGSISRDTRTTVMIKNIPNKYSQKLLLNMLDNHCIHCNEQIGDGADEPLSAYDFVYLPIDFNNKCNVGYGFVNLTTPEATMRLYNAFHKQPWEVFNSRKICEVTYARLQGLEALKEHFRNSKFACDNDEYMPVVFCPPRDGGQLTDPAPIGGRTSLSRRAMEELHVLRSEGGAESSISPPAGSGAASSTTTSTHAPSDNADGGDDDEHDDNDEMGSRLSEALRLLLPRVD